MFFDLIECLVLVGSLIYVMVLGSLELLDTLDAIMEVIFTTILACICLHCSSL